MRSNSLVVRHFAELHLLRLVHGKGSFAQQSLLTSSHPRCFPTKMLHDLPTAYIATMDERKRGITDREAAIAQREERIAARETDAAAWEAELAAREAAVAVREERAIKVDDSRRSGVEGTNPETPSSA